LCRIKIHKTSFYSIEKNNELIDLIHSNISDIKFMQTRCEKKYYIIFIDNCTIYCYTYLSRNKDEAFKIFKHYYNEIEINLTRK
jgi:hypothetical protein